MGRATGGRCTVALLLFLVAVLAAGCASGTGPSQLTLTTTASPLPSTATPAPSPSPHQVAAPPNRDLIDLARRFRGLPADAPRLARQIPYAHQAGDSQQFAILDLDTPAMLTISATLRLVTDHAYFFVEDGVPYSMSDLQAFGDDFEVHVYPTVTAAFGSEWSPGVDSDPHITIVHVRIKGAGGYFTLSDEFPVAVAVGSNEREIFYLDTSFLSAGRADYDAVLAHELQHLVHWNADPDEDAWVNEGLSQVAAEMVGGGTAGIQLFLAAPDTQLNDWPVDGDSRVHYAASELFFRYLLDRFGGTQRGADLARIPEDGIDGVDVYLKPYGKTFLDVFADWLAANYLDEESGPYAHSGADLKVANVTTVGGTGDGRDTVHQFAADYLEVHPPDSGATFDFDGSDQVSIGVPPHDGPFRWSNRGDGIDSRLTREFDLRGLQRATLRFWTWFQTEHGWDYAYVAASTDGGKTWRALRGRHTTDYDPVGQSYGPGYSGNSGASQAPAWVQEEVDLTPLAGQKVLLRFEYITDDSANLDGFAVDDIEVPELGFRDGADDDGGWSSEGFRLIQGLLPQQFLLLLIDKSQSPARVERIPVTAGNHARVILGDEPVTIVVAAVTEGTTEVASYRWSLSAP